MTEQEADHPIKFVEGLDYCTWRNYGEITTERSLELFGIDGDRHINKPAFVVIGSTAFTDLTRKELREAGYTTLGNIDQIRPFSDLKLPSLVLCMQFKDDVDDYYERMQKRNWEDIPNWHKLEINWGIM